MTDGTLLRSARQEAREQVWRTLTLDLEKEGRALRSSPGRFGSVYLKLIVAISLGNALGILTMAMMYLLPVFILHLELP